MRVGSLFSGIEGIGLGLEQAGHEIVWQCEQDEACRRVLGRHFPTVPCYEDVKEISGAPRVDVLCGGFPCQDVSVAGRRAGLAGERSGLFFEFMRLVGELAPSWVLIENVPGLLSSGGGRDMGTVLGTLADLGYGWAYRVLDAQFFGVAQRRRRVFIVGCAGDAARAAQVLFEPESCSGDSPPGREAGTRTAGDVAVSTLQGGGKRGYRVDADSAAGGHLIPAGYTETGRGWWDGPRDEAGTLAARDWRSPSQVVAYSMRSDAMREGIAKTPSPDAEGRVRLRNPGLGIYEELAPTLDTGQPHSVAYNPYRTLQKDGSVISGFAERPVVDALHGPTGNKEPLIADPMAVRRLTPLECERLQGFPDDWTAGEADSARYRMLGNAVCVPVARWIGSRLSDVSPTVA
jgi:DNA (cytosine-5)-methyltransferase 1